MYILKLLRVPHQCYHPLIGVCSRRQWLEVDIWRSVAPPIPVQSVGSGLDNTYQQVTALTRKPKMF